MEGGTGGGGGGGAEAEVKHADSREGEVHANV